jgi:hypothetical protein
MTARERFDDLPAETVEPLIQEVIERCRAEYDARGYDSNGGLDEPAEW